MINNKYINLEILLYKLFLLLKAKIGQRSRIYKMQDMYANSNKDIDFQTSSLVGARG